MALPDLAFGVFGHLAVALGNVCRILFLTKGPRRKNRRGDQRGNKCAARSIFRLWVGMTVNMTVMMSVMAHDLSVCTA